MNQKCENLGDLLSSLKSNISENEYSVEIRNDYENAEGFVGNIFAATLKNKKNGEQLSGIIKLQKTGDDPVYHIVRELFENETHFYKRIWKKLFDIYKLKTGKCLKFVPECLGTVENDLILIVLQDITIEGFELYDKSKCFDAQHFCLIFETYGIFHALSMVLKHQNIDDYFQFAKTLHPVYKDCFEDSGYFTERFVTVLRHIQNFFDPVTEKSVLNKIRPYVKSGSQMVSKVLNSDGKQGVLLHGDCWSNNLMFKYDVSHSGLLC